MKRFRVTVKFKDGSVQTVMLLAKDRDEAKVLVERQQHRRQARSDLTFARLEEAAQTGNAGLLAIDPRFAGTALTEAWVKAETEKRKADLGRYDSGFTISKIEEEVA